MYIGTVSIDLTHIVLLSVKVLTTTTYGYTTDCVYKEIPLYLCILNYSYCDVKIIFM